MTEPIQPNSDCFETEALCLNRALFHGDLHQAFSILADLMISSGQTLTSKQVADYYQRGLFVPFLLPNPKHNNG